MIPKLVFVCLSCVWFDSRFYRSTLEPVNKKGEGVCIDTDYPLVTGETYEILIKGLMPSANAINSEMRKYVGDVDQFVTSKGVTFKALTTEEWMDYTQKRLYK